MSKVFVSSLLSLLTASTLLAQAATPPKAPVQEKPKPAATMPKPDAKKVAVAPAAPAAAAAAKDAKPVAARRSDGTTATVEQIKDAQKILADKGLYKGAVTGRLNKDFRAALSAFQKQNKLNPTGRLNQETIAKLH